MIRIGYHLVDHCNLNCAGCNHFSSLVKKKFADLNLFEKNISHLSNNIKINEFNFVGGEPLLHKDIENFIIVARKYYNGNINIITNGILVTKMKPFFYEFLKEFKVHLVISNYNIHTTNLNSFKKLDKHKFIYNYISDEYNVVKSQCPFFSDTRSSSMLLLENGDLHKCCVSGTIDRYAQHFNKHFNLKYGDDYINIFNETKYTMLKFVLRENHYFCGYCRKGCVGDWILYDGNNTWEYKDFCDNSNVEC